MDASARLAFNMKVLKRHDPAIVDIIESASFVVLYSHDGEWTKTGIEGPMFLYRRSVSPPYGFFVLNRNGVENFSAHLTLDDDLELSTEFIIYRASKGDDVIGIWIFEPTQRESVGEQMLKLQSTPVTSEAPTPASVASVASPQPQSGKSISLDALFGTAPQPSQAASSPPVASPTAAAHPQKPTNGLSLLDSIFDSAKAAPQPATFSTQGTSLQGEEGLRALLGLQSMSVSSLPEKSPSQNALPALSNLAGTIKEPATGSAPNGSDSADKSAADVVDASLRSKTSSGASFGNDLNRRDFVREVLSLIHTDKDFVDDLYQRYLSRQA